ncbi:MAG TPA: discoidin domain-containing protein [Candidatus Solibacter sp.]|nr:discoidin domain-containing protein [Candidatus Solibacter sp.]
MRDIFSILFGTLFTVAVATSLGSIVIGVLRVKLYRIEAVLIEFITGAGCLGFLTSLLCLTHTARKGVFQWAGGVIIAVAIWLARRRPKRLELPAVPLKWSVAWWGIFLVFGQYFFFTALAPEISPDGSGYHLGNVVRMWRTHGFVWDYHSMYSYLSLGTEMLYLWAYSFGRHSAAALVHFVFYCSMPWLIVCWGRRFGYWKPAFFAGVAVFVAPVVAKDGASAYNDLAVVTVTYAVFYLLQVWNEDKDPNLLIIIGLLAGAAFAAKYTAFIVFPFAAGWVLWKSMGADRWRGLVSLAVPAGLIGAPWVLRNWFWLGNPAAPFLNAWFPNPYYHPGMEHTYAETLRHYYTIKHYWQIPLELTIRGGLVEGLFGPVFALFPAALFALRFKIGRQVLAAALVFAIPAYFNVGARFLIPCLPFVALAMGIAFARVPCAVALMTAFQVFLCWPPNVSAYCTRWSWRIGQKPIEAALYRTTGEQYMNKLLSDWMLKTPIEVSVPPGQKVFTFAGRPEAYIDRDLIVSYESTLGNLVHDILWTPQAHLPGYQIHFKMLPVTTRGIRVVNMASHENYWTVAELRFLLQGREVQRAPGWKLSAKPNGWEVQLAFDNSYATRWSTWQAMSPGDRIQVEFPSEQTVDDVVLECEPAWEAKLEVWILQGGRWMPITNTSEAVKKSPPEGIRRAAARDVKALGFHYILLNEGDLLYEDLVKHASYWGFEELAKVNGTHFYRIE